MLVYNFLSAEHALSNIALRRIRISRYAELNDPFELFGATFAEKQHRRALREWRKTFNSENGLLCFSLNWANPVLWSHYAVKHRGMCLVFELSENLANPVAYSPQRIEVRFKQGDPNLGLDPAFIRELQTTKYTHWGYEEEVRVFVPIDSASLENGSAYYSFSHDLHLRGVILGHLCELPLERVRLMAHGMYECISVIKARLAFKSFNVVGDEASVREDVRFHEARGTQPLWRLKESSGVPTVAASAFPVPGTSVPIDTARGGEGS